MLRYIMSNKKFKFFNIRTSGTTIVSLLVGMALSVFLITAVLQVFTITRRNYRMLQNITEINNSVRYAVSRMASSIIYSGYKDQNLTSVWNDLSFSGNLTFNSVLYTPQYSFLPLTKTSPDADFPTFASQGTNLGIIRNCLGTAITSGYIFTQFSIVTVTGRTGTSLRCANIDNSGSITNSGNNIDYLIYDLMDTTTPMNVMYGYDLNNDGSVDYYAAANTANKNRIRAVRITLLVRSRDAIFTQPRTQVLPWPGGSITRANTQYLYKVHTFTVPLIQLPPILP
jgi:Tfp pilus assembly protein PilW